MKKNWFRAVSPCVIIAVVVVIVIIGDMSDLARSGGWSMLGVIIFLPFLLTLILTDAIAKFLIKNGALKLWVTEIILTAVIIFIFLCFYR